MRGKENHLLRNKIVSNSLKAFQRKAKRIILSYGNIERILKLNGFGFSKEEINYIDERVILNQHIYINKLL